MNQTNGLIPTSIDKPITIYIAGDSTAAIKVESARPETGWGEYLGLYFNSKVTINNCAVNARSTKSFIDENRLAAIEAQLQVGDYLFIQFGHNDGKIDKPDRYTSSHGDYQANLKRFITAAQAKGATPILLTSVTRLWFIDDGIDPLSIGDYPAAVREVAKEEGVLLLDIHKRSCDFFNQQGVEKSKDYYLHLQPGEHHNYPNGIEDNTHFSPLGANAIAILVVEALKQSRSELKRYLNNEFTTASR